VVRRAGVLVLALALCSVGAYLGLWWLPFVVGVATGLPGLAGRLGRGGMLAATVGAVLGWALSLAAMALASLPVGATARIIAGLAGLPPYAGVTVVVVLLLAALQVLVGAWLARAVFPRKTVAPEGTAAQDLGGPRP
jgi:hypothetical protein